MVQKEMEWNILSNIPIFPSLSNWNSIDFISLFHIWMNEGIELSFFTLLVHLDGIAVILSYLMDNFLYCTFQDNLVNTPSSSWAKLLHNSSILHKRLQFRSSGDSERMNVPFGLPPPHSLLFSKYMFWALSGDAKTLRLSFAAEYSDPHHWWFL